jgi:glycosyltransferase involved in cell wall biosynthesis
MKRRLAFVGNTAWTMLRFRKHILQHFFSEGWQVLVYAPHDSSSKSLEALGFKIRDFYLDRKGLNPLADLVTLFSLIRLYLKDRPDFIFHYTIKPNIWGTIAARIAGIPSIAITPGLGYVFVKENFLTRVVVILYKFAFTHAREVWFLNETDCYEFVSRGIVGLEKSRILPGEGVDIDEFELETSFPDSPVFLMVSRLIWDKGVAEFVEMARAIRVSHPRAKFQLLGAVDEDNPSAVSFQNILAWQDEGLIEYLGVTEDVKPYIAACTVVVLPSFYREGLPRVLLEGAAMGRLLLTTDTPGCRSVVINGENGYLVRPKETSELVKCAEKIATLSIDELRVMGQKSRNLVVHLFGNHKVLQHYVGFLNAHFKELR